MQHRGLLHLSKEHAWSIPIEGLRLIWRTLTTARNHVLQNLTLTSLAQKLRKEMTLAQAAFAVKFAKFTTHSGRGLQRVAQCNWINRLVSVSGCDTRLEHEYLNWQLANLSEAGRFVSPTPCLRCISVKA